MKHCVKVVTVLASIASPVLALLFASIAIGSDVLPTDIPSPYEKGISDRPADAAQPLKTPVTETGRLRTYGNETPARPAQSHNSTEQKLQMIRKELSMSEGGEYDEPLIEKSDVTESVGIPLVFNDAVEYYISYFTTTKRKVFNRWLQRKKRYAPIVRQVLREHGLPEDLVYLAMIESGLNVQAFSPAKAVGPWQFIEETGKRYGLEVNHWVDERRDIRKSTVAAARYLQELFNQFGDWYLAAAGYNAGENRVDRLIRRHDTKDFWELRAYNTLPRETREYVPQLIAAAIIAKDPEKYGMGDTERTLPFEFIRETIPGGVPLQTVAQAASTDISTIRSFNPEIRRGITPPGKDYGISLPLGTDRITFQSSLTSLLEEGKKVVGVVRHIAGRKESVGKITQRYGVSREDLALVNGSPLEVRRGACIYVPQFQCDEGEQVTLAQANRQESEPVVEPKGRSEGRRVEKADKADQIRTVSHVVRKGESLKAIAAKYRVDVKSIKQANNLKTDRVARGTKLRVALVSAPAAEEVSKSTPASEKPSPSAKRVKYRKKTNPVTAKDKAVKRDEPPSKVAVKRGKATRAPKAGATKGKVVHQKKKSRAS